LPESRTTFFGTRYGNRINVDWSNNGMVLGLDLAGYEFERVD